MEQVEASSSVQQNSPLANKTCISHCQIGGVHAKIFKSQKLMRNRERSLRIPVISNHFNEQKKHGTQMQVKQCRICLEGEDEGRIIQPCVCSGSITFAHVKCLTEWIKRKHDPRFPKVRLSCELCHTPFNYRVGKRRKLDAQQFCHNYQKQRLNFLMFLISSILIFIISISLTTLIVISSQTSNHVSEIIRQKVIKSENIRIIYICVVFMLIIVLMFIVLLFLVEYAVKSEIIIYDLKAYDAPTAGRPKARVYPKVLTMEIEHGD